VVAGSGAGAAPLAAYESARKRSSEPN